MNNFYNQNGQFGGGGQYGANPYSNNSNPYGYMPGGYGANFYNSPLQQEKNNDKKILKTVGAATALAILLYISLSAVFTFVLRLLMGAFPGLGVIIENTSSYFALESIMSVLFIFIPFVTAYLILRKKKIAGILPFGTAYNRKAAVSLVMFMLPVTIITSMIINMVSFVFQSSTGIEFSGGFDKTINGPYEIVMAVISVAVLPAIVEEFAIRGVVLQPLRRYGDWFAIICSALIFSLLHGNMVQIPYTFTAGIFFGIVAVATGSIWPSVILHFLNNLFSVAIMCIQPAVSENAANAITFLMLGAIIIIGIIGAVIYFTMSYRTVFAKGVKTLTTGEKAGSLFGNPAMVIALIVMIIEAILSINIL